MTVGELKDVLKLVADDMNVVCKVWDCEEWYGVDTIVEESCLFGDSPDYLVFNVQ